MKEFMEDSLDLLVSVVVPVLGFLILVGGLIYGMASLLWYTEKRSCTTTAQTMQVDSTWDRWTGCMVEIEDGKWIPLDNYYYKQGE